MKRPIVFLWGALIACQGESEAPSPEACETPGYTSTAEAATPRADLDGQWIVLSRLGPAWRLTVAGTSVRAQPLVGPDLPEVSATVDLKRLTETHWRVSVVRDRAVEAAELVLVTPDRAWLIRAGENGSAELLRVGAVPAALHGDWEVVFSDNYHLAGGVLHFDPDALRLTVGDRVSRSGAAFGASDDSRSGVLVSLANGDLRGRLEWTQVEPDVVMLRTAFEDQFMLLARDGVEVDWWPNLGERPPSGALGAAIPATADAPAALVVPGPTAVQTSPAPGPTSGAATPPSR